MHNYDRGMIKWMPFNSVVSSKQMVREILLEKNKIKCPIISDDDKKIIEQKIIDAYYEKEIINIDYFYEGNLLNIKEKIKKIDFTYHKIYFNNKIILFNQIIKVY